MNMTDSKLNSMSCALLSVFFIYMVSCHKSPVIHESIFQNDPVVTALDPQTIEEASGIADSRINQGYLWVEEDSGNPSQLHLVSHQGKVKKTIFISNATNRDWEDMTIAKGPDPSLDYLYVADIGDNGSTNDNNTIYRFPEPSLTVDTVWNTDRIRFTYPDGARDAEAFLVDDLSKEIYIISKRDTVSHIYRMKAPVTEPGINKLEFVASLKFNGVVSAALSPDRHGVLIKTYSAIFYYDIKNDESLEQVFKREPAPVTYQVEPQGEAICFLNDNSGFFTLSEMSFASTVKLYLYKRK